MDSFFIDQKGKRGKKPQTKWEKIQAEKQRILERQKKQNEEGAVIKIQNWMRERRSHKHGKDREMVQTLKQLNSLG